MTQHYIVCRLEIGWCSGPGNGRAARSRIEIMGASATEQGARRIRRRLGGFIRPAAGPLKKYDQNEILEYVDR